MGQWGRNGQRIRAGMRVWMVGASLLFSIPLPGAPPLRVAASIPPLGAIVREVVKGRMDVVTILPAGFSPELYDITPSDMRQVRDVRLLFYVDPRLDQWVLRFPVERRVALLSQLPARALLAMPGFSDPRKEPDPHFWTDPLAVNELIPAVVKSLCEADREGCPVYERNGASFRTRNENLHERLTKMLSHLKGRPIALFHPSFQYLFHRYGIPLAAVVEPFPGKEPSPRYLQEVIHALQKSKAVAVCTEVQLPARPAKIVAEAAKIPLLTVDPLGGVPGRYSYEELLLFNATGLAGALP